MLGIAHPSLAQSQSGSLLGPASIGTPDKPKAAAADAGPPAVEVADWTGQRFVFLPQPTSLQHYGYQGFRRSPNFGTEFAISYEDWVGKIVTVTNVYRREGFPGYTVEFATDSGDKLYADALTGSINGIAPVADIEFARTRWLGKSLWLRRADLTTYDASTDKYGSVVLGRTAHVTVDQVVAGTHEFEPVRLILRGDDGRVGFADVAISGTNVSQGLRNRSTIEEAFYTADPRQAHKDWSQRVWTAIVDGKVFVGMSAEQAKMSWGVPQKVNLTIVAGHQSEQWVYGQGDYLYIENGIVTSIQGGGQS